MNSRCLLILVFALQAALCAQPVKSPPVIAAPGGRVVPAAVLLAAPLSPASREKIAAMAPIFDGRTLEGWIQAPPAPLNFSGPDIMDLASLAKKLRTKSDAVSAYLSEQLDAPAQAALAAYVPTVDTAKELTAALVKNLNRLVAGPSLFQDARFRGVRVREETAALRRKNPQGQELMRLNRVLLEDAYRAEFTKSPATSWMVKDGAMASTGAGRGVIYSKNDYSHYRLIFQLRHVAGKPDHQPCILIFGTRPVGGECGLDALGGIQFQTPNGGHWDYRAGHNNAGSGFINPTKTNYDAHAWHQVELLVNAADGTARMAVAQPVGSKAIENCDFRDPSAGKAGPIAWQMHNSGLFDEFKDIRIEIDPKEDRLITVE